jgi:hypothetical protein
MLHTGHSYQAATQDTMGFLSRPYSYNTGALVPFPHMIQGIQIVFPHRIQGVLSPFLTGYKDTLPILPDRVHEFLSLSSQDTAVYVPFPNPISHRIHEYCTFPRLLTGYMHGACPFPKSIAIPHSFRVTEILSRLSLSHAQLHCYSILLPATKNLEIVDTHPHCLPLVNICMC